RIADARPGDLDRVALNQYLSGRRRPGALLRLQRADANVAEILNHKQSQVAPLHRPGFNPARQSAASLRVAHAFARGDGGDQFIIQPVCPQGGRGRIGFQIAFIQLAGENRIAGEHRRKGRNPDGDGERHEDCTRALLPEIAYHFLRVCRHQPISCVIWLAAAESFEAIAPSTSSTVRSILEMSRSCVAITTVVPRSISFRKRSSTALAVTESRLPVGASAMTKRASVARRGADAARCR